MTAELQRLIDRWRFQADKHTDRRDSYAAQILRSCALDLARIVEAL